MDELAEWGTPTLVRTALAVTVAVLLIATCIKWLRLRSPDGELWAWPLLLVQGAMFATLTIRPPTDWLPQPDRVAAPLVVPAVAAPVPVDAVPETLLPAPKAIPLRLDVPEHRFDRHRRPFEVFVDWPHRHGRLARLP